MSRWYARKQVCACLRAPRCYFRLIGTFGQLAFTFVPDEIRLHPRALAGYRRERGKTTAGTPLVEAPWFVAPPKDRRDNGMRYIPPRRRRLIERAGSLMHSTFSLAAMGCLSRPRAA